MATAQVSITDLTRSPAQRLEKTVTPKPKDKTKERKQRDTKVWVFCIREKDADGKWQKMVQDELRRFLILQVTCLLGCIKEGTTEKLQYSASTTSNIKQHLKHQHGKIWDQWNSCIANGSGFAQLTSTILENGQLEFERNIKERDKLSEFWKKLLRNPSAVENEVIWLIWSMLHNVSRYALNDPFLDLVLRR